MGAMAGGRDPGATTTGTTSAEGLTFTSPDLARALDALEPADLDDLDFGVIGFDEDHVVVVYNAYESRRAAISAHRVLGRNVFEEVAPCINNYLVSQRYLDEPDLDDQLDFVFTLRMRPTPVRLRLLARRGGRRRYLLVLPRE